MDRCAHYSYDKERMKPEDGKCLTCEHGKLSSTEPGNITIECDFYAKGGKHHDALS